MLEFQCLTNGPIICYEGHLYIHSFWLFLFYNEKQVCSAKEDHRKNSTKLPVQQSHPSLSSALVLKPSFLCVQIFFFGASTLFIPKCLILLFRVKRNWSNFILSGQLTRRSFPRIIAWEVTLLWCDFSFRKIPLEASTGKKPISHRQRTEITSEWISQKIYVFQKSK